MTRDAGRPFSHGPRPPPCGAQRPWGLTSRSCERQGARRARRERSGLAGSSCLLYLGGMALNDYADRDVDAVERPQRPIPSGRVQADFALRLAQALTAAGVVTAGLAGGRRSLAVAVPLAATIWAYDLALKNTPAGPVAMAGCRALDVLLGASPAAIAPALAPAAVVGGHTLAVTVVSRHEAAGGSPAVGRGAACAAAAVTAAAGAFAIRRLRGAPRVRALAPARPACSPSMRRRSDALPSTRRGTRAHHACSAWSAPGCSASSPSRPPCSSAPGARPQPAGSRPSGHSRAS